MTVLTSFGNEALSEEGVLSTQHTQALLPCSPLTTASTHCWGSASPCVQRDPISDQSLPRPPRHAAQGVFSRALHPDTARLQIYTQIRRVRLTLNKDNCPPKTVTGSRKMSSLRFAGISSALRALRDRDPLPRDSLLSSG